jgi:hypothetical protein
MLYRLGKFEITSPNHIQNLGFKATETAVLVLNRFILQP